MRPIDAEVVEAHLNDVINDKFVDADFKKACWGISIYLDTVPTIEAETVKHSKWIKFPGVIECSICGGWIGKEHTFGYKYCPHCGAKMDLEELE